MGYETVATENTEDIWESAAGICRCCRHAVPAFDYEKTLWPLWL